MRQYIYKDERLMLNKIINVSLKCFVDLFLFIISVCAEYRGGALRVMLTCPVSVWLVAGGGECTAALLSDPLIFC